MAVITFRNIHAHTHLVLAQLSHGSSASLKLVSHRIVIAVPSLCTVSSLCLTLLAFR